MTDKSLPDKKALDAAIDMEEKGHKFFVDSAAEAKDKLAKEVFQFLAGEELNHIKAIKRFNEEYLKGKSSDSERLIDDIKKGVSIRAIEELFKALTRATPLAGSDLDVYKFAMDFERKGEAFYKKAEAEAKDLNAKKLYGFLVGEERRHFKIVESCLNYFENPAEFFHQREKWHLEA
jgi:rubrerythrin